MVYDGCWNGLCIVGGVVAAALLLMLVVRRSFTSDELRVGHDATGNLLAIVGTLYAVLLGLVVVDAMGRFEQAVDVVQMESNCLTDVFLIADRLPEPQRSQLRDLCRTYARQVVQIEWPAMKRAKMSVEARKTGLAMIRVFTDFEPRTEADKVIYPELLGQLRTLWDHRRERAGTAEYGIPAVEWGALILGAAVVLFFAGLFHVDNTRLHSIITILTGLVIGLNLYLVALFGYPFSGDLSVSCRPFELDIAIFSGQYDDALAHGGEEGSPAGGEPNPGNR